MQCAYSLQLCIEMHYTEGNRAVISCTKKDSVVFEKLGTELTKKKINKERQRVVNIKEIL